MKKILLILSLIITFNAYSRPMILDFHVCKGTDVDGYITLKVCIQEYLDKGYEIIGTRSSTQPSLEGVVKVDMGVFVGIER